MWGIPIILSLPGSVRAIQEKLLLDHPVKPGDDKLLSIISHNHLLDNEIAIGYTPALPTDSGREPIF